MQIIFAEIFVPQDFTKRLLLGSVDPQTRVYRHSKSKSNFAVKTLTLKNAQENTNKKETKQ